MSLVNTSREITFNILKLVRARFRFGDVAYVHWDRIRFIVSRQEIMLNAELVGAYNHESVKADIYRDVHFVLSEMRLNDLVAFYKTQRKVVYK